jgi:hypothetical protein
MEREEWRKKVEGVSLLLGEKTAEDDDEDEGDWDKRSRDIYLARGKTRTRTNEEPTHSPSWLALAGTGTALPPRQDLKKVALQIFGFGNMRKNRVIERLRQMLDDSDVTFRVHAGVHNHLQKHFTGNVMGAGESGQISVRRQQLERA